MTLRGTGNAWADNEILYAADLNNTIQPLQVRQNKFLGRTYLQTVGGSPNVYPLILGSFVIGSNTTKVNDIINVEGNCHILAGGTTKIGLFLSGVAAGVGYSDMTSTTISSAGSRTWFNLSITPAFEDGNGIVYAATKDMLGANVSNTQNTSINTWTSSDTVVLITGSLVVGSITRIVLFAESRTGY